jgi:phage tail-like protein
MPNELINADPIVARHFYLEFGTDQILLSSVSGFDMELGVSEIMQNGKGGKQQLVRTMAGWGKPVEVSVTRMAPADMKKDPIWTWFLKNRESGMKGSDRSAPRKSASVVLQDGAGVELGRFNFEGGWPSKIVTSELRADSTEPLTETITFQCESIYRVK